MKILYAVQGTGNGHISRSKEVIKELGKNCQVDILVSESQHEVDLGFEVKYKLKGLGFTFGKKGGIDYITSFKNARFDKLITDIYELPIEKYDIVVSDFEPVSSWACRLRKKPCISLSHQTSFMSPKIPRPDKPNNFAEFIIKWYAPVSIPLGLHFKEYDSFIKNPIIRQELRECEVENRGHYTVYLPSFEQKNLIKHLKKVDVKWEMFSKHYKGEPYYDGNVKVHPISYEWFIESFSKCEGILCNAGFETPSEALYLGKKLFAVPMKGQYEQECNAEALKEMGVNVLERIGDDFSIKLENWINSEISYHEEFENIIPEISELILEYTEQYRDTKDFDYTKINEELVKNQPQENKFNFFN